MVTLTRADPSSFSNSLASIMHKGAADFDLPDASSVRLAELREPLHLEELYPANDISAYIWRELEPAHGVPPQRDKLVRLDMAQEEVSRLGEHPDFTEISNAVNAVLLDDMKITSALRTFSALVLAG